MSRARIRKAPSPDARIIGGGTVYLVRPVTEAARDWLEENVSGETTWFAGSLAVEHRYLIDLVAGMRLAGLTVEAA